MKAEATTLRTEESSIGGTVEQRQLVELPLNGRNVGNFATLNPGVQFSSRGGYDGQSGGRRRRSDSRPGDRADCQRTA